MSPALLFIALALASYRVWRLGGRDDITEFLRRNLGGGLLAKMVTCEWCLGTTSALAVTYLVHTFVVDLITMQVKNRVGLVALWAVAVSCVVGLIGTVLDK